MLWQIMVYSMVLTSITAVHINYTVECCTVDELHVCMHAGNICCFMVVHMHAHACVTVCWCACACVHVLSEFCHTLQFSS